MKFILYLFILPNILFAQKAARINYLNETPPGQTAKIFSKGKMSTNEIEHSAPAFSKDGRKVVWAIMKMPSYQMQMLEMNNKDGQWSKPQTPSFSDSLSDFGFPNFSVDGKTLFFSSNKKIGILDTLFNRNRLWCVSMIGDIWGTPQPVENLKSDEGIYNSTAAANGNLYFTYGPQGSPDWNILFSHSKKRAPPTLLSINTKKYEDGPYIHPQEKYIIFESDRAGSVENSIDLYISFKRHGRWAEPVNMGPKINTGFSERFARVSPDGKFLFFGSTRYGNFDIFWIDASIINELKSQK